MNSLYTKFFLRICKTSIKNRFKSEIQNRYKYSKEAMINELNFTPIFTLQETIIDTANSLIDCSVVE